MADALNKQSVMEEVLGLLPKSSPLPVGLAAEAGKSLADKPAAETSTSPELPLTAQLSVAEKVLAELDINAQPNVSAGMTTVQKAQNVHDAINQHRVDIVSAAQKQGYVTQQQQRAYDNMQGSIKGAAQAAATIQLQKDTSAMEAQDKAIDARNKAGGMDYASELLSDLTSQQKELAALLEERNKEMADDPTGIPYLDAIINGFSTLQLDGEIAAKQGSLAHTQQSLQSFTAASSQAGQIAADTTRQINADSIDANYKLLSSEYEIKAQEAELRSLQAGGAGVREVLNLSAKALDTYLTEAQLYNSEEDREIRAEERARQLEVHELRMASMYQSLTAGEFDLVAARERLDMARKKGPLEYKRALQQYDSAVKAEQERKDIEKQVAFNVQRAQASLGHSPEDSDVIINNFRAGGKIAKRYEELALMGTGEVVTFGNSAAEADARLTEVLAGKPLPKTKGAQLLMTAKVTQQQKYTQGAAEVPRNKEQRAQDLNVTAVEVAQAKSKAIITGDKTNPFHAPSLQQLAENSATISKSKLYTEVLKPAGVTDFNPQQFLDLGVSAVNSGKLSYNEFVNGITAMGTQAVAYNNTANGGFGAYGLPQQANYNAVVDVPQTWLGAFLAEPTAYKYLFRAFGIDPNDDTFALDITNRAQVNQYAIKSIALLRRLGQATEGDE